jgi:ParB family chromosome partitioning protein
MPKKGRLAVDPLKNIATSGFIGYVEEEEEIHKADEPGVIWVEIEKIHDNPYQHAENLDTDDYQALVASIKADGFQGALNVSPLPTQEGHYFLNGGGHQRRNAAREAGLTKLPVFVSGAPTDRQVLAFRVARENTTRVNTSIINLGYLYQQMIDEFGLTQEEIAQRINKDRNHVKFALTAARSPADIQEMLRKKPESLRAMIYFRRLEREEDRKPIMDRFLAGELSTEGVRQAVEAVLTPRPKEHQDYPSTAHEQILPVASTAAHAGTATMVTPLPTVEPTPVAPDPSVSFPAPVPMVISPLARPVEPEFPKTEEVSQQATRQKQTEETTPPTQEARERLRQIQTILQMLQNYKRQITGPGQLIVEELRVLGEINLVTSQLLDAE